jgi:hypothetical protein
MSSHHFVKEGQEPALFIIDPISFSHVQSLLEWAPLVVVADTALDDVLSWGIKIDVVLADITQLEKMKEKISAQTPVQLIPYSAEEDIVKTGLQFLLADHQHTVTLISKGEDIMFSDLQKFSNTLKITLLNETTKWSFIAGKYFKKWIVAGSILSLRGTTESQQFSTSGFSDSPTGVFKALNDSLVAIDSSYPFWVGESL